MKIAIMLAGRGKRFGTSTKNNHKALIPVKGQCTIDVLFKRFIKLGLHEIYIVTGHCEEKLVSYIQKKYGSKINLCYRRNPDYLKSNNMYSMGFLEKDLSGNEFLLINGDSFIGLDILKLALDSKVPDFICIDQLRKNEKIDSPGVYVESGEILDLGRHISQENRFGYAIGVYKFSPDLSKMYFTEIRNMVAEGLINAGFHDPLLRIFGKHPIAPLSIKDFPWTDLDSPEDMPLVESVMDEIQAREAKLGVSLKE